MISDLHTHKESRRTNHVILSAHRQLNTSITASMQLYGFAAERGTLQRLLSPLDPAAIKIGLEWLLVEKGLEGSFLTKRETRLPTEAAHPTSPASSRLQRGCCSGPYPSEPRVSETQTPRRLSQPRTPPCTPPRQVCTTAATTFQRRPAMTSFRRQADK